VEGEEICVQTKDLRGGGNADEKYSSNALEYKVFLFAYFILTASLCFQNEQAEWFING